MRTFIFTLSLLLGISAYSQITFDFQPLSTNYFCFKLSDSETKFFDYNVNNINSTHQLSLYNMDGSLFKTIPVPADSNEWISRIEWISRTLFDNDPSNIEFLVCYATDSSSYTKNRTKVIREDGTIMLDELHADIDGYFWGNWVPIIYTTESGTKLKLDYAWAGWGYYYQSKVFNLPGNVPSGDANIQQSTDRALSIFPNPNDGSFYIKFFGKAGETNTIDLYNGNGKHIDTFKSDNNLIHVNKYGLPDGMYFLNNRVSVLRSTTKMIIEK